MIIQRSYKSRARKKFLAWAISVAISALPMMGIAAEKININTPNSDGLSSNMVDKFNVTNKGTVLNNSQGAVTSQLAGTISGNPNLAITGSAKMILMQVTGSSASALNGVLEVAGSKADLVVANTNGITANGLKLINTGNTYLTTGQPSFYYGSGIPVLNQVYVPSGKITVQGNGITDVSGNSLNLYSRTAQVDGKITAQNLNVILGTNLVNPSNPTNPSTITVPGTKPANAISVGALGGMYASNIALLSTEKGVGVNNAGKITAQGTLSLTSTGALTNTATATIDGGSTKLVSNGKLTNGGHIFGNTALDVTAGGNIVNNLSGVISLSDGAQLNLSTAGNLTNKGNIQADFGAVNINANGSITNNAGQIAAAGNAKINAANGSLTNSNAGQIIAGEGLTLTAATGITNSNSTITGNTGATLITRGNIDNNNAGSIRAIDGPLTLTAGGDIYNTGGEDQFSGSLIQAVNDAITATAGGSILNDGYSLINAAKDSVLTAQTGDIDNQNSSDISVGNGSLTLNAKGAFQDIRNGIGSSIYANDTLNANAGGDITNHGQMQGIVKVQAYGGTAITNHGEISGTDIYALTPNMLTNTGSIEADKSINTYSYGIDNGYGKMLAGTTLTASCTGNINNNTLLGQGFDGKTINVTSLMGSITVDQAWNVNKGNSLYLNALDNIYVNQNVVGGGENTTVSLIANMANFPNFGQVYGAERVSNPYTLNGTVIIKP